MGSKTLNTTERQATLALLGLSGDVEDEEETQADNSQEDQHKSQSTVAMHNNLKRSYDLLRENEENEERKYYPQRPIRPPPKPKKQRQQQQEQRQPSLPKRHLRPKPSCNLNELPPPPPEKYVAPVFLAHPTLPPSATALAVAGSEMVRIGKKRRDHEVVNGQFDDAPATPAGTMTSGGGYPHPSLMHGGSGPTSPAALLSLLARNEAQYQAQLYSTQHQQYATASPSTTTGTLDAQQQQQMYEQQRQHLIETMIRAQLALEQLPPPTSQAGRQHPQFNPLQQHCMGLEVSGQRQDPDQKQPASSTRDQFSIAETYRAVADNFKAAADKYRSKPRESSSASNVPMPDGTAAVFRKQLKDRKRQIEEQAMKPPPLGLAMAFPTSAAADKPRPNKTVSRRTPHVELNGFAEEDDETASETRVGAESKATLKLSPANVRHSTKLRYELFTPPSAWGELAAVPKMKEVPPDDDMKSPVDPTNIRENDVLLGRGGLTNTNPGNVKFRGYVAKYRTAYNSAPKGDKGALARYLCNYVRANEGRFLRKEESTGMWIEVGDEKAVGKCAQALREGPAAVVRKVVTSSDDSPQTVAVNHPLEASYQAAILQAYPVAADHSLRTDG